MKLTDAQIRRACHDYAKDIHDCEVCQYLGIEPLGKLEVHHIRGGNVRRLFHANEPCNLIVVADNAHDWGHDKCPAAFEVACWYAKWTKECRKLPMDEYGSVIDWKPAAIDLICDGGGFKGRLEGILLPKLTDAKFVKMANELLKALGE